MKRLPPADCCFGLALLSLPLVGVDLYRAVTGSDLGAGLQPAYVLIAGAWLWRLFDLTVHGRARGWLPGRGQTMWRSAWFGWILAWAGILLISGAGLWLAPSPVLPHEAWPRFAKQLVQVGIMGTFLLYPALWVRGPRRWRWVLVCLSWATALQLGYAVLQGVHMRTPLPVMDLIERIATSNPAILSGSTWLYLGGFTEFPRLRGSMCEPLYLGNYLVGVLPLLQFAGQRRLAAAGVLVLWLTWSRGAWFAAAVALVVWWCLSRRAGLGLPVRRAIPFLIGAVACSLVVILMVAGPRVFAWPYQRLLQTFDQSDWSNLTRYFSYQAAWRAWLQSPIVGVGWGQYPYHFYALVDLRGLQSQFAWPVVNSLPLRVLCETGLLGFSLLLSAFWTLWRRTWRAMAAAATPRRRGQLAAAAAGCCGLGAHLLVFSQYNLPHLWVLLGLWLAALVEAESRTA